MLGFYTNVILTNWGGGIKVERAFSLSGVEVAQEASCPVNRLVTLRIPHALSDGAHHCFSEVVMAEL